MVLLTSSAVSVVISSSIVCLFTFLLFLSGYVLQQQTVTALREAIRQPPEPKPVPTLPPQFRTPDNQTTFGIFEDKEDETTLLVLDAQSPDGTGNVGESIQVPILEGADQVLLAEPSDVAPASKVSDQRTDSAGSPQRLAYIFALLEPSDLCAALLFAKQHRSNSQLPSQPSIVLLYPSTWESDTSSLQTSALSFMRDVQDLYDLVYRPVHIREGVDVRAQLLGELQWKRWDYDQALYLRTPGATLDGAVLDSVLGSSNPRDPWAPLNPASGDNPDVLLLTKKGLHSPRKEMRRLAMTVTAGHAEFAEGSNAEVSWGNAAYMVFEEEDLGRPGPDNELYRNLVRQFEEGRRSVCSGSGLLDEHSA
ncbi:hypothetical protein HRR83_004760 [Exophiala dermatitidis]|uniref:Uncharacterized protein n=1 Tax=Exophiala dermatitidis TaxID=5970 RepID=A0AAN6EZ22_EXODE|nr:hypothetical protein HRR75_003629 [Exophiala dermatitidis]KAJ4519218.1 hypothetical protein HRR74_003959 [Exophiala dermatitidis]KAJ4529034.1 hypothetical protein HRR73_000054 [Exophiala dermatitidis]KAJ4538430.1 hypothetical protein HRR77_006915 [Exophiala dermatitidis]KAJ4544322.1 hypothetical protein HRR76_002387 [Exophiala dermatitidis]